MISEKRQALYEEIEQRVLTNYARWGDDPKPWPEWVAILAEEIGELVKAHRNLDDLLPAKSLDMRVLDEFLDVIAVLIAWFEQFWKYRLAR